MSLKITMEDGLCKPQVFCDHCGRLIERAQEGNYTWRLQGFEGTVDLKFEHKTCSHAYETHRGGGGNVGWEGLDLLLFYLGNALDVDWKKTRENAALYSRL